MILRALRRWWLTDAFGARCDRCRGKRDVHIYIFNWPAGELALCAECRTRGWLHGHAGPAPHDSP